MRWGSGGHREGTVPRRAQLPDVGGVEQLLGRPPGTPCRRGPRRAAPSGRPAPPREPLAPSPPWRASAARSAPVRGPCCRGDTLALAAVVRVAQPVPGTGGPRGRAPLFDSLFSVSSVPGRPFRKARCALAAWPTGFGCFGGGRMAEAASAPGVQFGPHRLRNNRSFKLANGGGCLGSRRPGRQRLRLAAANFTGSGQVRCQPA